MPRELHRQSENFAKQFCGEDIVNRTARGDGSSRNGQQVSRRLRNVFDMVRHQDRAGTIGRRATLTNAAINSSRPARSSPAFGSSSSTISGSLNRARARRVRWRSPLDSVPNACSPLSVEAHHLEPVQCHLGVLSGVAVPPRFQRPELAAPHDLFGGELGPQRTRPCRCPTARLFDVAVAGCRSCPAGDRAR